MAVAAVLLPVITDKKILFILALPVAVSGKQLMAAATGKIFLINILAVSIGAVAVAPSDENIIYVGEGENTMRGNVSEGLGGMWRSDDGGRTWKNIGLKDGTAYY